MEANRRLRTAIRNFYFWLGSLFILGLSPIIAGRLIDRGDALSRAGGVLVGIAGSLPWMWAVYLMVRQGDEFARRIHLVAMAAAFVGGLILVSALHWLTEAGFIRPPGFLMVWLALLLLWLVAAIVTKRYFERAS